MCRVIRVQGNKCAGRITAQVKQQIVATQRQGSGKPQHSTAQLDANDARSDDTQEAKQAAIKHKGARRDTNIATALHTTHTYCSCQQLNSPRKHPKQSWGPLHKRV